MGNTTGPNNPTEVAAQSRFGIAGVGWQNNNKGSNFSHEAAAAKQIKLSRPAATVMVTRDTQVVTSFWDSAWSAMTTRPEFFLRDPRSGLPVSRAWVSPAGNTPKFWLHFSNAHAAAWWEEAFYGAHGTMESTPTARARTLRVSTGRRCSPSRRPVRSASIRCSCAPLLRVSGSALGRTMGR